MRPAAALIVFAALVFAAEAARVTSQGSANAAAAAAATSSSSSTSSSKAGNSYNAGTFNNNYYVAPQNDYSWASDYNLQFTGRDVAAGDAVVKDYDFGGSGASCTTNAGGAGSNDNYNRKPGRRLSEACSAAPEACSAAPGGYVSFPSTTVSANDAIAEFEGPEPDADA